MGFDHHTVQLLLAAKRSGVCFDKVVTIGRQSLHLNMSDFQKAFKIFNIEISIEEILKFKSIDKSFAEPFLRWLGAEEIDSIDIANYEGASIIHDMNQPIPDHLKKTFNLVIDGGSLEHVFNFPIAIKNCLEMINVGGHFIGISPTNNFMGHGFYQLSPELLFRIFSEENGFIVERMIIFENLPNPKWYEIMDPAKVQSRVGVMTFRQCYLFIQAKKINYSEIFSSSPQQSDYAKLWDKSNVSDNHIINCINYQGSAISFDKLLRNMSNSLLYRIIRKMLKYPFRFKQPFFKRIDITKIDQ